MHCLCRFAFSNTTLIIVTHIDLLLPLPWVAANSKQRIKAAPLHICALDLNFYNIAKCN
jgi:hypothetical protein